jgi:hypothetical protein
VTRVREATSLRPTSNSRCAAVSDVRPAMSTGPLSPRQHRGHQSTSSRSSQHRALRKLSWLVPPTDQKSAVTFP